MKYATIGTSWITEIFISAANLVENMELKTVCSRNEEKAAEFALKTGAVKSCCSLEAIACDSEIDGVYIASPNYLHFEQSRYFLEHGKNVICEKPATTTEEEYLLLKELAADKGLVYCEAIMSIHTDAYKTLLSLLPEVGTVRTADIVFCQLSSKYPSFLAGENPNIFNPELHTGCLMDIGVYNIYLAAALFGMPEKIISHSVFLSSGADASGSAVLIYPGFSVNLIYSKVGQSYSPSEIIGDKGTISIASVSQLTGIEFINTAVNNEKVAHDISRDIIMSGEAEFFKRLCENSCFDDKDYIFAHQTAVTVRRICDIIRKQNSFLF